MKMSLVFNTICLLAIIGFARGAVQIKSQNDLTEKVVNFFFMCSAQLDINTDFCGDILNPKLDVSDKKYDSCKCISPCVAKHLGLMNTDDGKWNKEKYWEVVSLIEVPEWKAEAEIIGKNCEDDVNTHCSAGYPLLQCILKHSKMFQALSKNYLDQKQADIDAANSNESDVDSEPDEKNDDAKN